MQLFRSLANRKRRRDSGAVDDSDGITRAQVREALAIVLVSILAATMVWRASVADDAAGSKTQLAAENLLQQQELTAADRQYVLHDISVFNRYEEDCNLARALSRDAAVAPAGQARSLTIQAQRELELARSELPLYENVGGSLTVPPSGDCGSGIVSFDAGSANDLVLASDNALLDLQAPSQLRAQAHSEETKELRLTGLAVLFVAALVLFTFAEVTTAAVVSGVFAVSAAVVALTAAVLFFFV